MPWLSAYSTSPGREGGRPLERQPSPARAPAQKAFFRPGRVFRSQSSQNLRDGTRSSSPGYSSRATDITDDLNTLPDPRNSNDSSAGLRTPPRDPSARPEYSEELAALTTKLINSINHQTTLDDNLQRTRHELEAAREQIVRLEQTVQKHRELVANGALLERTQTENTEQRLRNELAEERSKRIAAEKERKGMELELENLTSSLFEQANTMVADARRENANAERRSEQLKVQLRDSEVLLASHQQQLRELKTMLEQIQQERDEATTSATPQTPVRASRESSQPSLDFRRESQSPVPFRPIAIDQPLRFTDLIRPILRNDLPAYDEFMTIVQAVSKSSPSSRVSSASMGNSMNISYVAQNPTTGSSTLANIGGPLPPNASMSPSLPGSFNPGSPSDTTTPTATLEKSKFYKRILAEDIDPTLRLDAAPGLSFFARRTVVSSMMSNAFVVEPWPPTSRFYSPTLACSLCGEQRKGEPYMRRHRFRTSDNDDSQRYPLCAPCLEKVRATCELVGFLKLLKNGQIWRADSDLEEARLARLAWEDCVRLRERMFWARVGGGVMPVYRSNDSSSPVESSQPRPPSASGSQVKLTPVEELRRPVIGSRRETSNDSPDSGSTAASEGAGTAAPATLVHELSRASETGDAFVDAAESPSTATSQATMDDTATSATTPAAHGAVTPPATSTSS